MSFNPKYNWLRWIAVLPAAFLASVISYLLVYYVQRFFSDANSGYVTYWVPCESAAFSGGAMVYYGAWVAPTYKKTTALILLILSSVVMGAGIFITVVQKEYLMMAKDICSLIGSGIGYGIAITDE
jgi:hypothetical protein